MIRSRAEEKRLLDEERNRYRWLELELTEILLDHDVVELMSPFEFGIVGTDDPSISWDYNCPVSLLLEKGKYTVYRDFTIYDNRDRRETSRTEYLKCASPAGVVNFFKRDGSRTIIVEPGDLTKRLLKEVRSSLKQEV